jgi:hypothetical protein
MNREIRNCTASSAKSASTGPPTFRGMPWRDCCSKGSGACARSSGTHARRSRSRHHEPRPAPALNGGVVRLVRPWAGPGFLEQTPGGTGHWGAWRFTEDPVPEPDAVIVCNFLKTDLRVRVSPDRVWMVFMEPPDRTARLLRPTYSDYSRIVSPDPAARTLPGGCWAHGSVPWMVGRSFDELAASAADSKTSPLAWVTSNARRTRGHRLRLQFLDRLRQSVPVALWGRGFRPLTRKWEVLAPARFALAIENHSAPHYWTEKVADCFLAGTFPIYWGAPNLADYFPREAFEWIDIADRAAPRRVAELLERGVGPQARDALEEARRRVLFEHQFFPRMAGMLDADRGPFAPARDLLIPRCPPQIRSRIFRPHQSGAHGWLRRLAGRWTRSRRQGGA